MHRFILLLFLTNLATAAVAQNSVYLEEKTAFCFTQNSLADYLSLAKQRNLQGMNLLVLTGECDFVTDGENLRVVAYRTTSIGDTTVVEFQSQQGNLWTVKSFLQPQPAIQK